MKDLEAAIYDRYLAKTERVKTNKVGLEFELPIVNLRKEAVDFDIVHRMCDAFWQRFNFTKIQKDDEGYVYACANPYTNDILSFDCSYNTVEFSLGTEEDMHRLKERFYAYYDFVKAYLNQYDHTLTGMGINPYYQYNRNVPVKNERYRMLLHHLRSYTKYENERTFHSYPNFGLFSCASQVQLDVEEEDLVEALNTFTKLEPYKALLLSNSPFGDEYGSRDAFWRDSLHGYNAHNVDMYEEELHSIDEIVAYIKSMSLYCVMRDGKYVNFKPTPLETYFASGTIEGEFFDGKEYRTIQIHPEINDLEYLRSFKFEDLTFRGTIEFRSVCEQPVKEIMASSALHVGLLQNLHALTKLMQEDDVIYQHGLKPHELRRLFVKKEGLTGFDEDAIKQQLFMILEIAQEGLKQRRFNEEEYLAPLKRRAKTLLSPAKEMDLGIQSGKTLEEYIEEYS